MLPQSPNPALILPQRRFSSIIGISCHSFHQKPEGRQASRASAATHSTRSGKTTSIISIGSLPSSQASRAAGAARSSTSPQAGKHHEHQLTDVPPEATRLTSITSIRSRAFGHKSPRLANHREVRLPQLQAMRLSSITSHKCFHGPQDSPASRVVVSGWNFVR